MLVVDGLSVRVEEKEILHDASLKIRDGEVHAILVLTVLERLPY